MRFQCLHLKNSCGFKGKELIEISMVSVGYSSCKLSGASGHVSQHHAVQCCQAITTIFISNLPSSCRVCFW